MVCMYVWKVVHCARPIHPLQKVPFVKNSHLQRKGVFVGGEHSFRSPPKCDFTRITWTAWSPATRRTAWCRPKSRWSACCSTTNGNYLTRQMYALPSRARTPQAGSSAKKKSWPKWLRHAHPSLALADYGRSSHPRRRLLSLQHLATSLRESSSVAAVSSRASRLQQTIGTQIAARTTVR